MTSTLDRSRVCKDCAADPPRIQRPAPWPGPRCKTHHLVMKKRIAQQKHDSHVKRMFAAEAGWYPRMKAFQKDTCAICQRAKGISKALAVDHDHKLEGTGEDAKRGLLCGQCNSMLAHAHDDPAMFERAVRYLKSPPARLMKFLEENNDA